MKNNKKVISLALVVCMVLAMLVGSGCGNGTPGESTPSLIPEETPPTVSPEESTPEATPEASTPEASSPEASAPESTPLETEPSVAPGTVYSISYDLAGGMNPKENPDSYTYKGEDVQLFVPIRKGYAFVGWTGTGLEEPTRNVVISADSTEDKAFTAVWRVADKEQSVKDPLLDKIGELMNSDKNTPVNPNELPLSATDLRGLHGEGIFLARTAYTDITVDGVMDAAYTYGLRFELDMVEKPNQYKNTGYDVYMVRGQDGKMHVFVHVADSDIVLNDDLWAFKWWHCDTWQMYIDFDNDRNENDKLWTFAADPNRKYLQDNPENWIVVMTEDGFNIEFEFDNQGEPFAYGDEFSFGFFYNDSSDYKKPEDGGYKRTNSGTKSVLDPKFHFSNARVQDAVRMTSFPLTYEGDLDSAGGGGSGDGKTGNMLVDIAHGMSGLTIVTGKHTLAYNEINAETLLVSLQKLGIRAQLVREDKISAGQQFEYALYINAANDADSRAVLDRLNYSEYGVVILENKIVAAGWTSDANDLLNDVIVALFQYAISTQEELAGENYVYTLESIRGANVPKVEGTYCIVDSGDDSYNVVKPGATAADYEKYCKLLENAGYKLHSSNKMATVTTATYYNDDTVINVLYGDAVGDKAMRVVVETMEKTNLPTLGKENYEPTSESSVTQVDLGAGMCFIIKLDNGEFIIVDSGNQKKQDRIYSALKELHGSDDPMTIAAWIFTHFHQDHIGGFLDFLENEQYMSNVTIKSIMYNPPERFFLEISKKNSAGDRANILRWPGYIAKLQEGGTKVYKTRTGQKFYFGNAEIEIIGTFDDLAPFYMRADSSNHTSIQFSVTMAGKKMIFIGDSTSPELLLAAKRYGDYLKSDIVQLAHHGNGDGGSDNSFYKAVAASTVLHPGTSLNGGAERWAANNAKTVHSYGKGNITVDLSEES